jgi:hypothetical protein
VIKRDNGDNTYDIEYDDGETEDFVEKHLVREPQEGSGGGGGGGSGSSYNGGGLSDEKADDGFEEKEEGGLYDSMQQRGRDGGPRGDGRKDSTAGSGWDAGTAALTTDTDGGGGGGVGGDSLMPFELREGAAVEARYNGDPDWVRGVIKRDNGDDTYDIEYDDGESEDFVEGYLVREPQRSTSMSGAGDDAARHDDAGADAGGTDGAGRGITQGGDSLMPFELREGAAVEARYNGDPDWVRGVIKRDNGDDTYDIEYDDGETEDFVEGYLVREPQEAGSTARVDSRDNGDDGLAGAGSTFGGSTFGGSVSGGNDTGESAGAGAGADDGLSTALAAEAAYTAGAGDYSGDDKYADDKYDADDKHDADDKYDADDQRDDQRGTHESDLSAEGKSTFGAGTHGDTSGSNGGTTDATLAVGERVEARHGGQAAWYAGEITAVVDENDDGGAFDIRYDDDDEEKSVPRYRIRRLDDAERADLVEGEVVDSRHGGMKPFYSGRIERVCGDGTFDVLYDDDDREEHVPRSLIEAVHGSAQAVEGVGVSAGAGAGARAGARAGADGLTTGSTLASSPGKSTGKNATDLSASHIGDYSRDGFDDSSDFGDGDLDGFGS